MIRALVRPLALTTAATTALTLATSDRDAAAGVARFSSACARCFFVYRDYATSVTPVEVAEGEASAAARAARRACDQRSAEVFVAFAKRHGGVYAKLAQYISTLNHALPAEWTETCAQALSAVEPQPWGAVKEVFEADFGRRAEDVFASIEETPIASASIAQVHRAVLKSGERVAVKLQYPGLRARASADLSTMRFLASMYALANPTANYGSLCGRGATQHAPRQRRDPHPRHRPPAPQTGCGPSSARR